MSIGRDIKDPTAVLPYHINWATKDTFLNDGSANDSGWLKGSSIISSVWTIEGPDSDLDESMDSNTAVRTTIWLSQGIAPGDYELRNRIVASDGRIDTRTIKINVRPR